MTHKESKMINFPVFETHTVQCFNCSAELKGGTKSANPPKRGQYVSELCPKCLMKTWYDIKEHSNA